MVKYASIRLEKEGGERGEGKRERERERESRRETMSIFLVIKILVVAITFPLPHGMLNHLGSSSGQKGRSEIGLGAFVIVLFVSTGDKRGWRGHDRFSQRNGGSVATATATAAFPLSISVTSTYVHQPNRYSTRRLVSLDSTAHSYFRRTSTVTRERARWRNSTPSRQTLLSLI